MKLRNKKGLIFICILFFILLSLLLPDAAKKVRIMFTYSLKTKISFSSACNSYLPSDVYYLFPVEKESPKNFVFIQSRYFGLYAEMIVALGSSDSLMSINEAAYSKNKAIIGSGEYKYGVIQKTDLETNRIFDFLCPIKNNQLPCFFYTKNDKNDVRDAIYFATHLDSTNQFLHCILPDVK